MLNTFMIKNVVANTTGIAMATTMPERKPSESRLTASTMTKASINDFTKSLTELATMLGCNVTGFKLRPTGRFSVICAIFWSKFLPNAITSPPSRMLTPSNKASVPLKRAVSCGGSA